MLFHSPLTFYYPFCYHPLDGYPGMNFAHHCSYAPKSTNPDVFECATIGGGIRDCQKMGKKLLISLGGDTCDGSLGSAENAKKLAYYIWNMFLGGKDMQNQRPFLWYGLKYFEVFYSIN